MATAPDAVRSGLQVVTGAALAEFQAVSAAAPKSPKEWRATVFAVAPLIVSEYAPAASSLALDWYEEIRVEAAPRHRFIPTPRLTVTDDDVSAAVAMATETLHDHEQQVAAMPEQVLAEANAQTEAAFQRIVASGFWDTITGNSDDDPDAVGWRRYTSGGGCRFCRMLADRGAVYSEQSVNFAAHKRCHCVAGPAYDRHAPRASAMQYVASRRTRSPADESRLRDYLDQNFPDAPG